MRRAPIHPAFRAKFTSAIYRSRTDEFAPFGTDEGGDLLDEWSARVDELSDSTTLLDVLLDGAVDKDRFWSEIEAAEPQGDLDDVVIAAGFVLLRLTGQIDEDGRELVLAALYRSRRRNLLGQSRYDRMIADLGGEVPGTPAMSDELREMIDPRFRPWKRQ